MLTIIQMNAATARTKIGLWRGENFPEDGIERASMAAYSRPWRAMVRAYGGEGDGGSGSEETGEGLGAEDIAEDGEEADTVPPIRKRRRRSRLSACLPGLPDEGGIEGLELCGGGEGFVAHGYSGVCEWTMKSLL